MEHDQSIESKEIRGFSLKNLYSIIASVVVITASIFGTYYGLRDLISSNNVTLVEKINTIANTVNMEKAVNTMHFQTIDRRIDALETQQRINDLEKKNEIPH